MTKNVFTIADELKSLIERVNALENTKQSSTSKSKSVIRQNQIIEITSRLDALEKLNENNNTLPLESRVSSLESRPKLSDKIDQQLRDIANIKKELSQQPVPVFEVDLSSLENRISALENRSVETIVSPPIVDLSPLESRIEELEKKNNNKKVNVNNDDRLETLITILKAEHPVIAKRL